MFPALPEGRWPVLSHLVTLVLIVLASAISWSLPKHNQAGSKIQAAAQTYDARSDADEIRLIIEKYAKSVDQADTALASQIWWNSPDVSFIHPLGHEHGFEQIKQNVYRHLMGETFSERKLSIHDVSVQVYGDGAWAEFYWDFEARFRKDGTPITTHGRETQVYRKTQGGWRLVHVHYSGMPVAEKSKGF